MGEQSLDELQWQANDIRRAAGDQAERQAFVLESAGAGFSPPESALEVPLEEVCLEVAHFELAFVGGAKRSLFGVWPEADAGDNPVRPAGERLEHVAGFGAAGGLAEFPPVDLAEGVTGEDQPACAAGCHGLRFCPGEPQNVGFEGFIGAPSRGGCFCLVRGRDNFDVPAGLGGELSSAR